MYELGCFDGFRSLVGGLSVGSFCVELHLKGVEVCFDVGEFVIELSVFVFKLVALKDCFFELLLVTLRLVFGLFG